MEPNFQPSDGRIQKITSFEKNSSQDKRDVEALKGNIIRFLKSKDDDELS